MYRRLLIAACALSLASCGDRLPLGSAGSAAAVAADAAGVPPPVTVADRTLLDEKVATTATVSYSAASRLGARLAKAGLIDKARFKALDNQGFEAVLALEKAYRAANAASFRAALDQINAAVASINGLLGPVITPAPK
jgi:hypothetical protein